MPEVWFIRHGQSVANAGGVIASLPSATELTALGKQQAECLPSQVSAPPTLILTSPYLRAQQTAQPVRQAFPLAPCETWPVHEFTYLDEARCRNTTREQRHNWVQAYWNRADPAYIDGEGAEAFAAFMQRVDCTLTQLRLYSPEAQILVFSHGIFMRGVCWRLLYPGTAITPAAMGQFRSTFFHLPVANASLFKVRLQSQPDQNWLGPLLTGHLSPNLLTWP